MLEGVSSYNSRRNLDSLTCRAAQLVLLCVAASGWLDKSTLSRRAAAETVPANVDDSRLAAAGIRKLEGRHLVLYTDLPSRPEIDSLPMIFDQAVPQWAKYFGVDPARAADWRVRAFLIGDRAKFAAAGLLPADNALVHGYATGSDLWVLDQPTEYYRQHLLLHEGTHAFMTKFLGGCGPGWYSEGMAELLATHRFGTEGRGWGGMGGNLTLNVMPNDRREVPMLGRIKLVRDAVAAGKARTLPEVMAIDSRQQLGNQQYAWCWAAAKFLDSQPRYRERFRSLSKHVQDPNFDELIRREFAAGWEELLAEWQAYVATLDHGYDFERMAIQFKRGMPLGHREGRMVKIASDRGWQSSGAWLEAGTKYRIAARGHYRIAVEDGADWPCEPGGVTIEYHDGRPLGILLGAIVPEKASGATFANPQAIGLGGEFTPEVSGTLYLRVNDSAARLGDNRGTLTISIDD
jgi:hypothetical protein